MAIGNVIGGPAQLLGHEQSAIAASKAVPSPRREEDAASSANNTLRQDFVLGAAAYRRVLAGLEADRAGFEQNRFESNRFEQNRSSSAAALQRDGTSSFTGQRAQRAYHDAGESTDRESLSSLFGVDIFV